ncbi:MAG: LytR/AlgR family response regulator transcription factor [Acetatifactor sp.]
MKILICDDERKMVADIEGMVRELLPEETVKTCLTGDALLEMLRTEEADAVLLDIDMPEKSGLEVAGLMNAVGKKPILIFVTAHDELVYDSLKYHPFAFVRKRYLREELPEVLADCIREVRTKEKRFHFRAEGGEVSVLLSDIRYFEAEGNYLIVHLQTGTYRLRSTMTAVQNTLEPEGFIRAHKGFLVNQEFVTVMTQEELRLASGEAIPIGKLYAGTVKEQILRYMRE